MIINILVIGSGMYVCGRGTDNYGTVLPAIYEWKKIKKQGIVRIVGRSSEGVRVLKDKNKSLFELFGFNVKIECYSKINSSAQDAVMYKEAIRSIPKPACVIIAVPDKLHKELAAYAIKNNLHVLVVKPLAPTLREVKELVKLQQEKRVYCAVELHKRLDDANIKLKDTLRSGLIGDPLYFIVRYSQKKSIPMKFFKNWVEDINVFQYLGTHYVDIIYFATGAIPLRVMATGQKNWLISKGINAYDAIQGMIEWMTPSGKKFISCILTNWIDPECTSAMSEQSISVIGTKGRYESNQKKRGIMIVSDEKGIDEPNPYFCSVYGDKGEAEYRGYGISSIKQFLNDVIQIEEGEKKAEDFETCRPTFKQSVIPTLIIEAINTSLENNSEWRELNVSRK